MALDALATIPSNDSLYDSCMTFLNSSNKGATVGYIYLKHVLITQI